MYSTFPAGWGVLSPSLAQRLRRSGLKPGMPDMIVFRGEGRCFGIELKARKNVVSPEQQIMFRKLRDAGIHVYVCRDIDTVMDVLHHEQVPMRRTVFRGLPLVGGADGAENREAG